LSEGSLDDSPFSDRDSNGKGKVLLTLPENCFSNSVSNLTPCFDACLFDTLFAGDTGAERLPTVAFLGAIVGWPGSSSYTARISARISGGSDAKTEGSKSDIAGKVVGSSFPESSAFITVCIGGFQPGPVCSVETVTFFDTGDVIFGNPDCAFEGIRSAHK
jgi:hypothetical protein